MMHATLTLLFIAFTLGYLVANYSDIKSGFDAIVFDLAEQVNR